MNLAELKFTITKKMDELELLDILGITIHELVDLLEEQIAENKTELTEALVGN